MKLTFFSAFFILFFILFNFFYPKEHKKLQSWTKESQCSHFYQGHITTGINSPDPHLLYFLEGHIYACFHCRQWPGNTRWIVPQLPCKTAPNYVQSRQTRVHPKYFIRCIKENVWNLVRMKKLMATKQVTGFHMQRNVEKRELIRDICTCWDPHWSLGQVSRVPHDCDEEELEWAGGRACAPWDY